MKRDVFIFGAGKYGAVVKKTLSDFGVRVQAFVDNYRAGGNYEGISVCTLTDVLQQKREVPFFIISVKSDVIAKEMEEQLKIHDLMKCDDYVIWKEMVHALEKNDPEVIVHMSGIMRFVRLYNELERVYQKYLLPELKVTREENSLRLLFNLVGTEDGESIYLRYYLTKAMKCQGDVCEFGVAQGATSALLANEIKETDKKLWLFDSFEGLSVPTTQDVLKDDILNLGTMEQYAYAMKCDISLVQNRLKSVGIDSERVNIVPGFIEETIKSDEVMNGLKKVCFAYVDFDLYEPILIALEFLHTVTTVGSVIIVDDYDFFSTGAKTAVDEFCEKYQGKYRFEKAADCVGHFCIIERKG